MPLFLIDTSIVKLRIAICTLLAALLLAANVVFAQSPDPWKARERCVFAMPYIGHAVKPDNKGLVNDILTAVYEYDDIELEHIAMPYKRSLEGLRTGEIDCTLDVKNNARDVLQGSLTIAFYDLSVAYMRTTPYKNVQSLKGQRAAYLHGFSLDAFLPVKINPQLVYDLSSAFHMLERDHVRFILGDNKLLEDAMYESKLPSHQFVITKLDSFEVNPIFADTSRGRELRDVYDRRMRKLIDSGKLAEIMRQNGLSASTIRKVLSVNRNR